MLRVKPGHVYVLDLDGSIADASSEFQRSREFCRSLSCKRMKEDPVNPNYWCDWSKSLCLDWQKTGFFQGKATLDFPVYPEAKRFLKTVQRGYIVSGRSESDRGITLTWFERHGLPTFPLYLRGDGDPLHIPDFKRATVLRLMKLFGKVEDIWTWVDDDERIREAAEDVGAEFVKAPECFGEGS